MLKFDILILKRHVQYSVKKSTVENKGNIQRINNFEIYSKTNLA